ncbi:MAG: phosphomannomutase/phosphoglucomutase [Burkholderiaceae bacterium]|jgi:phosphomannomutase|nr:phosphomannomutase/phosphoglucomutase [Burkholderiaceae bacterium]
MQIDPALFKAYDIRGTTTATLNESVAEALGLAFGTTALAKGESTVAVGRDGRLSGPSLAQALVKGLVAAGVQVIDLGMVTTPMLYFAASTLCASGIQVTGSHNPRDDNGFKLVLQGQALFGDDITALRRAIEADAFVRQPGGGVRQHDIFPAYRDRIASDVHLARSMKVAVDCGNGVAGASAPAILRAIGCEVTELFTEVDGRFPNHHPDPSKPANLRDLQRALRETDAELGLAFDGDGDRLGVVTKSGETIFPDRQLVLFARDVLQRAPGATVVFDVKCTQRLAPEITAAGGAPLMYKTGHSLIKAKMRETGAALGGEMSGHLFFKERWYGFDDGTYAACRLLEILSRHADPSAVLQALPASCSTPEINVPCAPGEPHRVAAQLQAQASDLPGAGARVSVIDGLRVDWPDGFGLIRASNTTPVLVLRFEGRDEVALRRIEADMRALLLRVKPDARFDAAAH